ncbi:MAG: RHS repeat-associated core domain-containing protein [Bacteroidales bacterium]
MDRGFTGHEHLDQFGLINMNGRVYDPLTAMFLSPDNFIQSPDFTQNFNRYSYCLNNPLVFTDPSGFWRTTAPYPQSDYFELGNIASGKAFLGGYSAAREQMGLYTAGPSYNSGNGTYSYNMRSGEYENCFGKTVSWNEVYNNYVEPNSLLSFSGQVAQDLVRFLQNTGSGSLPSKSEYNASLTAGPGGAIDVAYKIANFLNEFNPVAQLWDVITYTLFGTDRFGNPMSLTQGSLKALCVVPIFKIGSISYSFGAYKASSKWMSQMASRGWTGNTIQEALSIGKKYPAINKVNPANSATRYVHPITGQSVVVDEITKEIIHLGGPGYKY